MPTLHSHTHCQVAQADTQAKTWQRVCLPNRTDGKRNNETLTLCISNSGFGSNLKVSAFNKLSGGGKVIALKSATAHTLDR